MIDTAPVSYSGPGTTMVKNGVCVFLNFLPILSV